MARARSARVTIRYGLTALAVAAVSWVAARYLWLARGKLPAGSQSGSLDLDDGTRLALVRVPRGHECAVVVAHGLLKRKDDARLLELVRCLLPFFDVILYDQPGHGESSGEATMDGERAALCLSAVVDHVRRLGYRQVIALGVSMGAVGAIRAAAAGTPLDAVVSISSPAGPPWSPVTIAHPGLLRPILRTLGVRLARQVAFAHYPLEIAGHVAPCPLLVVHCGRDTLVPRAASRALYQAAGPTASYLEDPTALHGTPRRTRGEIVAWMRRARDRAKVGEESQ